MSWNGLTSIPRYNLQRWIRVITGQNEHDGVLNHQPHDCLLKPLFRRRSKKTSKLRTTGLCVGNSPVTGEFTAQKSRNAEDGSIWWRHHGAAKCTSRSTFSLMRLAIYEAKVGLPEDFIMIRGNFEKSYGKASVNILLTFWLEIVNNCQSSIKLRQLCK